jgi:hypothetical protein
MIVVYKYVLAETDDQTILMPKGAKILSVGAQRDLICLWALINDGDPMMGHRFYIVGTGYPASHVVRSTFLGTVSLHNAELIFQVFQDNAVNK